MLQHEESTQCSTETITFNDEWDVFEAGVYRYGTCTVCGQQIREYYAYRELEAVTDDNNENVILHQR